jgi:hypothetical protein
MRIAAAIKKNQEFDPNTFLATIGGGRKILSVAKKETIFAQGRMRTPFFIFKKERGDSRSYP